MFVPDSQDRQGVENGWRSWANPWRSWARNLAVLALLAVLGCLVGPPAVLAVLADLEQPSNPRPPSFLGGLAVLAPCLENLGTVPSK
jgi:hypothetical protein